MRSQREHFYYYMAAQRDRILDEGATVYVARDREHPIYVYAFLVVERQGDALVCHWAHCKGEWRGRGIARALLAHAVEELGEGATRLVYTHCARVLDEATVDGRRKLVPNLALERKLSAMGFCRVPVETLLREREAA